MTGDELAALIAELRRAGTDTLHVEAKRAQRELPRRVWETLSAFANTRGGGVLVLGLDETSRFAAAGVADAAKVMRDLASVCDQMEPALRAAVDLYEFEGVSLVVAEVPELDFTQKPCYYRGAGLTNGAFIRVGDGDRRLTPYEVQLMLASRGQPREDETPVPDAGRSDLDNDLVGGLLKRLRQPEGSYFRRLDDDSALRILKVLVPHEQRWVPSLGGLLALGTYPQQVFPQLGVTFVAYPTPVVGQPGPRGERFLDNRRFDGAVPRLIRPLLDALERHMARRAVVQGMYRADEWEYPETALREALVNALAHRDLSGGARGTPVQVQLFPDRLTLLNPGGLFGPVTLDSLGAPGLAAARNPVLMKLLEDTVVPEEGRLVCENRGSGIGAMLDALQHAGLPRPDLVDRVSSFEVTFRAVAAAPSGDTRGAGSDSRAIAETPDSPTQPKRADRRRQIVGVLRERGELTRAEIAQALGLKDDAVRKWLHTLRLEQQVQLVGSSRHSPQARYRAV